LRRGGLACRRRRDSWRHGAQVLRPGLIVSGPPARECRRPLVLHRQNAIRPSRIIHWTSVRPPRIFLTRMFFTRTFFRCLATFLLACAAGYRLAADPSSAVSSPAALHSAATSS